LLVRSLRDVHGSDAILWVLAGVVRIFAFAPRGAAPSKSDPDDWLPAWKRWARRRGLKVRQGVLVEGQLHGWRIRIDTQNVRVAVDAQMAVTPEELELRIPRLEACRVSPASIELSFAARTWPEDIEFALVRLHQIAHARSSAYR
jgi:hypothetical protein